MIRKSSLERKCDMSVLKVYEVRKMSCFFSPGAYKVALKVQFTLGIH